MSDIATANSTYSIGTNDTASTLTNDVSTTDAQQWNGAATAIIGIETILGTSTTLKGSKADLVERLAVGVDADGKLKLSTDASVSGPLAVAKGGTGTTVQVVPTGVIIAWTTTSAPTGYLLCDGSAVNRTTYSTLFGVISTTYGVGDGSTTFNLPDLRGRVVIMVDGAANRITSASTNGGNADTLGGAGGAETHTLVTAEMAAHTHDNVCRTAGGSNGLRAATSANPATGATTGSTGSGSAHSNTQPWIALNYVIKT